MSAVVGLFQRDRRPIDRREVCALLERVRDRGPDHQAVAMLGAAALGHALLQTVPEDRPGAQPAVDEARAIAVVLDGRVDNRGDLAAIAGMAPAKPEHSDAELILGAFAAAGPRVFERILGDFAALVWDGPGRRLIAARDVFGIRPLVFREIGASVLVASEVRALVPCGPVTVNEGRVAELLAGLPTSPDESLYREVTRLQPGHLLIADAAGVRVERFTAVDGTRRAAPRPLADWNEQFRSLLDDAVRVRLRSSSGVGVMLSGGLDSTSVYSTIRTIAPERRVPAFTIAHRPPADESPVARATVEHHRGQSVVVPGGSSAFDQIGTARRLLDMPISPAGAATWALRSRAVQDGCRVLLSGDGGDEWYSGSTWGAADMLRGFRVGALARLWHARLTSIDPSPLGALAQSALVPLLPAAVRRLIRPAACRREAPPWLRREFVSAVSLHDRLRVRPAVAAAGEARRAMLVEGLHGGNVNGFEDDDRVSSLCGTEGRVPYYDRRVVEFALGLPDDLLAHQPVPKQFVRTALAARLPPLLQAMQPWYDCEFLALEGLERLGGWRAFERLALADAGYIDGRHARAAADACRAGRSYAGWSARELGWPLWSVAAVEVWFRTVTGVPGVAGH